MRRWRTTRHDRHGEDAPRKHNQRTSQGHSFDYQIGTYSDYCILHTTSPAHSVAYSSLNPPPFSMLQLASVYKLVHQKVHEWSYAKLCSQLTFRNNYKLTFIYLQHLHMSHSCWGVLKVPYHYHLHACHSNLADQPDGVWEELVPGLRAQCHSWAVNTEWVWRRGM